MRSGHPALLSRLLVTCALSCALAACATGPDEPNPPITQAERASLQNECVQIADNSQRDACLAKAAFAERW